MSSPSAVAGRGARPSSSDPAFQQTTSLAAEGGARVRQTPMPPWPYFDDDLIEAVTGVLRSGRVNYWTGEEGKRFEEELAASLSVKHAIVLANGTLALEAALKAVGVEPGDQVVTTSRTFVASATAAVSLGARPIFADVDRVTQNITAESVAAVLTPKTKAIVAVHLAGWPCDIDALMALAKPRGIAVIEDCAQAHGATLRGRPVGSIGDVSAWSYCQDKIMTTGGEGGAVTTNDTSLWSAMWSMKDHGKSYDAVHNRQHPPGFRWLHEGFGSNWRLTDMQSAMGRRLLKKLPGWTAVRRAHAARYTNAFQSMPALRVTPPTTDIEHGYYKYYAFVRPEALRAGWSRDRIMNAVSAEGVTCMSGSCSEIYRERCFVDAGMAPPTPLPIARELGETSLMFLLHPTMTSVDIDDTITAVDKVLRAATA
jgi:dTDP-4-amino-4,6-dideoxygalactose transaminase